MSLDEFFAGQDESRGLFEAVRLALEAVGAVELSVTRSQIAFRRRKAFAWVWMPGKYLRRKAAPLVLSIALRRRDRSPRWKEVVEPAPGRLMHHLELWSSREVDAEVRAWLDEAWNAAA
jgi:hypothetical protein